MAIVFIPPVIRIEIPSLDKYVAFLREVDQREQRNLQGEIDEATAKLKEPNDLIEKELKGVI